jgi:hypothetical protein
MSTTHQVVCTPLQNAVRIQSEVSQIEKLLSLKCVFWIVINNQKSMFAEILALINEIVNNYLLNVIWLFIINK